MQTHFSISKRRGKGIYHLRELSCYNKLITQFTTSPESCCAAPLLETISKTLISTLKTFDQRNQQGSKLPGDITANTLKMRTLGTAENNQRFQNSTGLFRMNIHETESDEKQGHWLGLSRLAECAHRPTCALKALRPHLDVVELEARHGEVLLVHEHRAVLLRGD